MKYILKGRVAAMDDAFTVLDTGAVYIDGPSIAAVQAAAAPPPAGFAGVTGISTAGTIFPGLIELHNHLSYNALTMWAVPHKFADRGAWQDNADYKRRVTGPMGVIARSTDPHLLASLVRYVETKCLLAGVTSSQGISLQSDHLNAYYRGAMRVVEDPTERQFPKASTHIPDVAASEWAQFKRTLDRASCLLLHLSEGLDDKARAAFLALQNSQGQWAISPALAGIHCAGLHAEDFTVLAQHGGSMVWSPLSNLLLYGGTANVAAARSATLPISLGSDWSPTGSKNLLNELKVAKSVCEVGGLEFTDRDLVLMATRTPASVVKWGGLVGSLDQGKRADLIIVNCPKSTNVYTGLIQAKETDMQLVMINGRAVVGTPGLMSSLGAAGEKLTVGGKQRIIDYGPGDPKVPSLTFGEARAALADALQRLPHLLADEAAGPGIGQHPRPRATRAPRWRLALDEQLPTGFALRPKLPFAGQPTGPDVSLDRTLAALAAVPLEPVPLDPVSVADDPAYAANLQAQKNLDPAIKEALKTFYPIG
jgi:cytosine/adenosine deaminase-related metal-dependent hydrolase